MGSAGGGLQILWTQIRGRLFSPYGRLIVVGFVGLLIGFYVGYAASSIPMTKQPDLLSMNQCMTDTLMLFSQQNFPTPEKLRDAREHCYSLIQSQGLLNDFAIRKLNFFQQYRANGVVMWMVVAVTFSGVSLAGLQLLASYQLAFMNKTSLPANDGELILKSNELVLKSSITGLFILLISFCFFLVFVFYVYRFETIADHSSSGPPLAPTLPMGGLGPPPIEKGKP